MISVFGSTGFIGTKFCEMYQPEVLKIPRDSIESKSSTILYLISTTDNYNVFTNCTLDIETNLIVLMKVLENFKNSKKQCVFNFVSSWFVYGDTDLPAREDSQCDPKGFYSITKLCAERLVESYCKTYNIDYRIIRLANVYGSSDLGVSKRKNALQFLISRLKRDEPIELYDNGDFVRDYIHVSDACKAIRLIMKNGPINDIINVGSGNPTMFKDIIGTASKILNSKSKIGSMSPPDFHKLVQVKDMYLDVTKLSSLGFKQKISIEDGIKILCQD